MAKENGFQVAQDGEVGRVEGRRASPDEDEGSGVTDPPRVEVINQNSATSSGTIAKPDPDKPVEEPLSSASGVESPGEGSSDAHLVKAGEPSSRFGATGQRDDERGSNAIELRQKEQRQQQQQQHQQLRPGSPTSTRSMVPDREDNEEDEHGRPASPRQYTLQNYASRESGATMLESSPGSKGMGNVLDDDKDKYAISPCEDRQWAVLGLSEDILVRTIKISSHEKYSSLVKEFQVLASQTYPVNEWLDLGTFTAKSVQGEQTFELTQPAFARYLKFKFLSHHGDEFYCTLTQVKVHGSTMLESFQHEWQQSSAEVREMQDMMKKDSKAAAGASSGEINGSSISSSGGGSHSNDGASMPTPGGSPHSQVVPLHAETVENRDGGVEHRPHAASAATVPASGKRPGVGSGVVSGGGIDGGAGETVKMEKIVRGVPSEIVITASAECGGPAETDGSCRREVIVDGVAGAEMDVGGSSNPLGAEVPTIGEEASAAAVRPRGGRAVKGVETGDGNSDDDHGRAKTSSVVKTKRAGSEPASLRREGHGHVTAERTVADEGSKQKVGEGSAADVNGTTYGGEGGGESEAETQAKGGDPPRKGIIHSTMEAISKAVHRGDGSKTRDGVDKAAGNHASRDEDSGPATIDGLGESIECGNEESTGTTLPPSSKFASTATGGASGDGQDHEGIAAPGNVGGKTERTTGAGSTADAQERTSSRRKTSAPAPVAVPSTAAGRVERNVGGTADVNTGKEGRGVSGSAVRTAVGDRVRASSVTREEPHREQPPGGCVAGVVESLERSCGSVGRDLESTSRTETDTIHASHGEAPMREGTERGESAADPSGPETELPLEALDDSLRGGRTGVQIPREGVAAGTQTLSWSPPKTLRQDNELEASGSALSVAEDAHGGEPLARVDDMDAAAMAAACLDRLTFSEFREEVLSRTQHAHHSAGGGNGGGGDAIGGQYESIFKTLMNKIKTLEINQSLFSLYLDDVHACYQDVFAQIIQEHKRARASQSELLHAQAAYIVRLSDQWPAFQSLQGRVVEVENRMLLSSMAWFTSLLCLAILVCSCCVNICRRLAVVGSNGDRGGDRDAGGRGRRRRGRGGRRYRHRDWSPACAECDGASAAAAAAAIFANGSDSPAKKMGWCQNDGVREATRASAASFRGHPGVASAQRSLSGRGTVERVQGVGVARSTSPGTARCSTCGEVTVGIAGDGSDARLEKRRW